MTFDGLPSDQASVDEQARLWAVKMASNQASELKESLEIWLSKSPQRREAYARARRNYLESAVLKSSTKFGSMRSYPQPKFAGRERALLTAGVSGALLIGIIMSMQFAPTNRDQPQRALAKSSLSAFAAEPLRTSRGEIRTFALEDGSSITLDSDSAAQIAFTPDIRTVRLHKGRARIEMAASSRPFLLHANATIIEGRKATIDVDALEPSNLSVLLLDGAAHMSANDSSPGEAVTLNFQPSIKASDRARAPATNKINGHSDWTTGWAEHREIRLDDLLSAANIYAKHPIEVQDKRLASQLLTGRFHIANTDQFLQHIGALLNLRRHDVGDRIILRKN